MGKEEETTIDPITELELYKSNLAAIIKAEIKKTKETMQILKENSETLYQMQGRLVGYEDILKLIKGE